MSPDHPAARSPALPRGGVAVLAGIGGSIVASAVAGGVVIGATDYDVDAPTGSGAYLGRVVGQSMVAGAERSVPGLPLWLIALLQIPLWVGLLGAPLWLARVEGRSLQELFGFTFDRRDVGVGLGIGALAQIVLVPALYIPLFWLLGESDVSEAARELTDKAQSPIGVILLVLVVMVGAPLVEELFFRGLLWRVLDANPRLRRWAVVVLSALVFGAIHLQVLQFPALVLFGLVAGVLVHRYGRVGPAVWAHVGFNGVTVVALLAV